MDLANSFVEENTILYVIDSFLKTVRKLEENNENCRRLVTKILIENNHEENRVHLIRIGNLSKDKEEIFSQQITRFRPKVFTNT
jgi:hypothetical protein